MCWVDEQELVRGGLYFGVSDIKSSTIPEAGKICSGQASEARGPDGLGGDFPGGRLTKGWIRMCASQRWDRCFMSGFVFLGRSWRGPPGRTGDVVCADFSEAWLSLGGERRGRGAARGGQARSSRRNPQGRRRVSQSVPSSAACSLCVAAPGPVSATPGPLSREPPAWHTNGLSEVTFSGKKWRCRARRRCFVFLFNQIRMYL